MDLQKYEWRTGRSVKFKHYNHLVFVTKYRKGVFNERMLIRMQEVIKETCEQMESELLEFNGEDNHVHMLVSISPKYAVCNFVGKLKGKTAYFLRKEFWEEIKCKLWGDHLWSPSYCSVSCGGAPLEIIKEYIQEQNRPSTTKGINQSIRERKVKIRKTTTG